MDLAAEPSSLRIAQTHARKVIVDVYFFEGWVVGDNLLLLRSNFGRVSSETVSIASASLGPIASVVPTKATDGTIAHGMVGLGSERTGRRCQFDLQCRCFLLHASSAAMFMILAWIGFSPFGTFVARYLKGFDPFWFQAHRGSQVKVGAKPLPAKAGTVTPAVRLRVGSGSRALSGGLCSYPGGGSNGVWHPRKTWNSRACAGTSPGGVGPFFSLPGQREGSIFPLLNHLSLCGV
jgi:hypothetical protein